MKLLNIQLSNIGLYKDKLISFDSSEIKNVSIFWGNNGAGKTTLLNSIKIGLLGNKALSYNLDDYCKFIEESLVSSRCDLNKHKAFIKIGISLKVKNDVQIYYIKREWKIKNSALDETVSTYNNEDKLNFNDQEDLLRKINNILPASLLDVIIFDGENAINILNKNEMHKLIKNIIYAVFGMDVYSNLIKDLNLYLKNYKNEKNKSTDDGLTLAIYENNYKKSLIFYNEAKNKVDLLMHDNQTLLNSLSFKLKKLSQKTNIDFDDINAFKKDLMNMQNTKKNIDQEIKYVNEEIIPLKILHSRIKKLVEELEKEKPYLIVNNIKLLENYFENDQIALNSLSMLKEKIGYVNDSVKYNLNMDEIKHVENCDMILDNYGKEKLNNLYANKYSAFTELKEKVNAVTKLEDHDVKDLMKSIEDNYNYLTQIQSEISTANEELTTLMYDLDESKREYEKLKKEIIDKKKSNNSYVNVLLYKEAIEEFLNTNINDICEKLNRKILIELNRLHFRNNSITGVDISPKTYDIKLYESNKKLIQSKLFSAGEKQILLGLVIKESLELADNDTFFLFDTPVGRLDMKNRDIFTNEVILKVSDQVAIFATDSDYSYNDYLNLKNNLTSEYKLVRSVNDEIVVKKGSIY